MTMRVDSGVIKVGIRRSFHRRAAESAKVAQRWRSIFNYT